ncbi:adhesion G-protein coupled receptor G5 isoform X1 [Esox lucius]|uniref:Adhesion G protein-coupled receptor G1 n=1 Tax=Esox lucius TaxID=8010 RepID=A0AAY5L5R6_ESOLU|nr:adhesion G-protein coupled receptor G5 isoform X1 [Esox lucius]XP_019910694.1 adhesion G-protein coupled receptor G5 isoform X1 [Esox lucius]XP_019910695.1 adhesion G-protein coupled receptor G5 isoform X1 [Esox lucius]
MGAEFKGTLWKIFLFALFSPGSGEYDRFFQMCGTWRHGKEKLTLAYDLQRGCGTISIYANDSFLSIRGQITTQCEGSSSLDLGLGPETEESHFCVYWEPLLDQLLVEVNGWNHTVCWPSIQTQCCTDLSQGPNKQVDKYGILNISIRGDLLSSKTYSAMEFYGHSIDCKSELYDEPNHGSRRQFDIHAWTEEPRMSYKVWGNLSLPLALISVVEMNKGFKGYTVALPVPQELTHPRITSVYLPQYLKPLEKEKVNAVCIFFKHSTLFPLSSNVDHNDIRILEDVVGITVENETITNLLEPVKIGYHHSVIPTTHSRKCVSWDTMKDPKIITWREEGCQTIKKTSEETECQCNHLTYFAILVQRRTGPVPHLGALTAITSAGCAASTLSCVVLIAFFCKKQRKAKEPSTSSTAVHLGLSIALFFLSILFFLTGTVANVWGGDACWLFGAFLHYSLLSSFSWMAIEVFHTFWLVYMVFSPFPKPYIWHLFGFGLPAVPVIVLLAIGNIYGVREVVPSDDFSNPYLMCWMNISPGSVGLLAHYLTNMTLMAAVVLSGFVMLLLVLRKIKKRDEWRRNRTAFLSIWGLSCLFGTTWGLGLLDFGPLSEFVLFIFCILNSLQGFFLMLRFYILHRMRKYSGSSFSGSSTVSSTKHHMLQ